MINMDLYARPESGWSKRRIFVVVNERDGKRELTGAFEYEQRAKQFADERGPWFHVIESVILETSE